MKYIINGIICIDIRISPALSHYTTDICIKYVVIPIHRVIRFYR